MVAGKTRGNGQGVNVSIRDGYGRSLPGLSCIRRNQQADIADTCENGMVVNIIGGDGHRIGHVKPPGIGDRCPGDPPIGRFEDPGFFRGSEDGPIAAKTGRNRHVPDDPGVHPIRAGCPDADVAVFRHSGHGWHAGWIGRLPGWKGIIGTGQVAGKYGCQQHKGDKEQQRSGFHGASFGKVRITPLRWFERACNSNGAIDGLRWKDEYLIY